MYVPILSEAPIAVKTKTMWHDQGSARVSLVVIVVLVLSGCNGEPGAPIEPKGGFDLTRVSYVPTPLVNPRIIDIGIVEGGLSQGPHQLGQFDKVTPRDCLAITGIVRVAANTLPTIFAVVELRPAGVQYGGKQVAATGTQVAVGKGQDVPVRIEFRAPSAAGAYSMHLMVRYPDSKKPTPVEIANGSVLIREK
jgi:hypothetical protein